MSRYQKSNPVTKLDNQDIKLQTSVEKFDPSQINDLYGHAKSVSEYTKYDFDKTATHVNHIPSEYNTNSKIIGGVKVRKKLQICH